MHEEAEKCMDSIDKIKVLICEIPPKWDEIRAILEESTPSKADLADIAGCIANECFCEYCDAPRSASGEVVAIHSDYLIDALRLLLAHGLDPNAVFDDDNIMWKMQWVDAPNVGADALRLLLEHGGDPNAVLPSEGESLFSYLNFSVSEDDHDKEYLHKVQCWLVLMAYGGCWDNGETSIEMLNGNDVKIFREFEQYDFTLEHLPNAKTVNTSWLMHVFNIKTGEEVGRY